MMVRGQPAVKETGQPLSYSACRRLPAVRASLVVVGVDTASGFSGEDSALVARHARKPGPSPGVGASKRKR